MREKDMRRKWLLAFEVQLVALALLAPPALADDGLVRTTWPSVEDPGPPYYARINPGHDIFNDGEWAAVIFYRDPGCVPSDFNLLTFFDPPRAFACELTVEGASLWEGEPLVGAPKSLTVRGDGAVPVWFIPADSIVQLTLDGVLTVDELASAEGLIVGTASEFQETLHPDELPPVLGGGGNPNPILIVAAHGSLEDGRLFTLEIDLVKDVVDSTRIRFE
jgi:hypothetical protein